ncbi:MAG TPA: radical SAM protein, partial [Desulfatiglandales bacterium]|nr:radical SAM protein [Desulfatiglandales bacterium]
MLKQNVLRTLELTVTPYCNVNCEMCYATKLRNRKRKLLTPRDYRNIWLQAKKLGAFSVVLSGGEPTTRKDLFQIVEALEPRKTTIGIVSNSILLDRNFLIRLKKCGLTVLHLSLNSVDPEENDRERDFPGHFEKVNQVIRDGKDLGFEVCLSTVVSHNELDRMINMVQFAAKQEIGVVFSLACP